MITFLKTLSILVLLGFINGQGLKPSKHYKPHSKGVEFSSPLP